MTDTEGSRPAQRGGEPAKAFDEWRRAPARSHAAALLLLMAAMTARYPAAVFSPGLDDELAYTYAFRLIDGGGSPYQGGYFYTPTFAYAGAWAVRHLGEGGTIAALRVANLLGIATAVWCSFAWVPWSWRRRLLAAAAVLCLSPAVRLGVLWGNLSLLVVGMLVMGLLVWRRRPLVAGSLLGLSVVIKPLGPVAVLVLGAHRPAAGGRRHLVAAASAAALAAALVLPAPFLRDMLSFSGKLGSGRNVSLQRLFHHFSVELSPWSIVVVVAAAAVALVRWRPLGRTHLLCLAATAALLATPILWSHTMLLALPVEVLAVAAAWYRRPVERNASPSGVLRRYELVLVSLLVVAIHFCEGMGGGLENRSRWLQVVLTIPALAPAVLTAYLFAVTDRLDPRCGRSQRAGAANGSIDSVPPSRRPIRPKVGSTRSGA